jgi:hypothetical protein
VEIVWPDGGKQIVPGPKIDGTIEIQQAEG